VNNFNLKSRKMNGSGKGINMGQGKGEGRGGGRGRNKGGAYGTGGYCICAKCGEKVPHERGIKCATLKCPECGHTMIREEMLRDKR
jgi:predicted RNA-binding Zn-ribbon protein involved in translation (DUF1610 family)